MNTTLGTRFMHCFDLKMWSRKQKIEKNNNKT